MTVFLAIAGGLCLVYYLVIICFAGITADFAWIWLLAAVSMAMGCGLVQYGKVHPGLFPVWLKYVVTAVILMFLAVFGYLCCQVISGMWAKGSADLDYVVVLGAQVKGEVPSRALRKRLEKALEYAAENENTVLILSGGQGSGEDITEAECMRRWLVEHGISGERLVLEEQSVSTKENLQFAEELTGCREKRTGILSNNFHVYRSVRLARKQGYEQCEGIAAASDPVMQLHYVVREVFALVKEKLRGNI